MYDNIQRGHYLIGKKEMYFRSKSEANYAIYLDWLKKNKEIKDWQYEPMMYEFPIKHGTTRYLPDFLVINNDGSTYLVEVKGFMDSKSKTKLKRMAKYFPNVKLELVDSKEYNNLKRKLGAVLKFY